MSSLIKKAKNIVKEKINQPKEDKEEYPLPLPPNDEYFKNDNIDKWEWIDEKSYIRIKLKTGPKYNNQQFLTAYQCSECLQIFKGPHSARDKKCHPSRCKGVAQQLDRPNEYPIELPDCLNQSNIESFEVVNKKYTSIILKKPLDRQKRAYQCLKCKELFSGPSASIQRKTHFSTGPCAYVTKLGDPNWLPKETVDYRKYTSDQPTPGPNQNYWIEYECLTCLYVANGANALNDIKRHFENGKCKENIKEAAGKGTLWTQTQGPDGERQYVCNDCGEVINHPHVGWIEAVTSHFKHGSCERKLQEAEDKSSGGGEYWKRVTDANGKVYYECLICDKKFTDVNYARRDCIDHMYARHRPFYLVGACMDCGLSYVTTTNKLAHEQKKKGGFDCKEQFEKKNNRHSCRNSHVVVDKANEKGPLDRLLETMTPEEVIDHLFGTRKYRCRCGYNTNGTQHFIRHVNKLTFPNECIITQESESFKELFNTYYNHQLSHFE